MKDRDASRYSVLKLEELIRNHINSKGNSTAKIDLSNMVVEGEDLTDALDNLGFETDEEMEKYKQAKSDYDEKCEEYQKIEESYKELKEKYEKLEEDYNKNLKQDIERLIAEKKGPFIDKIKKIIEE